MAVLTAPTPEPTISEPMTWVDICATYPDQWVGVVDIEKHSEAAYDIRSARVVCHSTNRGETVLLATHSKVLLDELSPEQVFVMKSADPADLIPTRLDKLCDPEWLAELKVGEFYEQGEIGSNKDFAR